MNVDSNLALEQLIEKSYAKLIAFLAARYGNDIAAAEDALSDAIASALVRWKTDGVPVNPEAWLMKTARNRLIDRIRHTNVTERKMQLIAKSPIVSHADIDNDESIPDERLELLFACAHPAIDANARTPMLLQVVLGLSVETIAPAFLLPPKTLSQRLVRAKAKIRDAGIVLRMPDSEELSTRLQTVLDSIYVLYGIAWDGIETTQRDLVEEAIRIARIVTELLPSEPEGLGLLSLLLFSHARRDSRRSISGDYVPLDEQLTETWNETDISEADRILSRAASYSAIGRYQLEAAIQSAHMHRRHGGDPPWGAILQMYRLLYELYPSVGVGVAFAAALSKAGLHHDALNQSDVLDESTVQNYQSYWAVRADVLCQIRSPLAVEAFDRAIGLSMDASTRNHLIKRRIIAIQELQ